MKIKINPFSLLLLLFCVFFFRKLPMMCLLLAALMHELSHLCLFGLFGVKTRQVEILPFGIAVSFDGIAALSYPQEFLCILAGPVSNFLIAFFFLFLDSFPLFAGRISGVQALFWCNFALGSVNLLPIYPLDGGRSLFCLLKSRLDYGKAETAIKAVSLLFLLPVFIFGLWLALFTRYNYSLVFIFAYLVFYLTVNGIE